MKLAFLYHPVVNIKEALNFYRNLGMEEAWREGEHTVALKLAGTDVQLMLEDDGTEPGAGGIFIVDSVDTFYQENKEKFTFVKEPRDIPPGRYAIFKDHSNNILRIIDLTKNGK
jgi:hypothetical protein